MILRRTANGLVQNKATVLFGRERARKFRPEIRAEKWNGQAYLHIAHPDAVLGGEPEWDGNTLSAAIGPRRHRMYEIEDGLEYEIEYQSMPDSLTETLSLDCPDGLVFYHQSELTPEEKARGIIRPENVVNSYAVYWQSEGRRLDLSGNEIVNYETGKFCHIYRPELRDAAGNRTWCEQVIDPVAKTLTITMPEDWLTQAVYPVILDPTFGYTSIGATADNIGNNNLIASGPYTPSVTDTVLSISLYLDTQTASGKHITTGIYPNSGSLPDGTTRVCSSAEGTSSGVQGWQDFSVSGAPSVSSASSYWLAMFNDATPDFVWVRFDSVAFVLRFKTATTYSAGNIPSTCPTTSLASNTYKLSIYATTGTPPAADAFQPFVVIT